ncbi:MAG TPA: TonB-dependent receptor, partial [Bryobacteraceae bacterium]|nr:TonB-dependent receptor [Bryobacteraceae bacterium]
MSGQTSMGTLTGSVTDVSGAAVVGASIRVTNVATGVNIETTTTGAGVYNVTSLVPGTYQVSAEKPGFEKTVVDKVTILASQTVTVDMHLSVGKASTSVTVTEATPLLTTSTQAVATTIERDIGENLPYAERSTIGAALLVPGVRGDPASPNQVASENPGIATGYIEPASYLSIGGAFPGRTSILVDGSDVTQASYPRAGISVSGDMLQEMTVVTTGLPAQYGRSQGGVIIQATRAGGNDYHFTATWRHSDPSLQSQQLGSPLPPLAHQNFFGGYAGGPVTIPKIYNGHNRTFFYVGVEPARLNNATAAQGRIATPAELAGHLNDSYDLINQTILRSQGAEAALAAPRVGALYYQFAPNANGFPAGPQFQSATQYIPIPNNDVSDQLAQNKFAQFVLSQMPTPQNPGPYVTFLRPDGLWMPNGNNIYYQRGVTNVDNRYSFRIDHTIDINDRIFGRYTNIPLESTRYFALPITSPLTQVPVDDAYSQDFALNEVHTFTPTLINEIRLMYMRDRQLRQENDAGVSEDWAGSLGLTPATSGAGFPYFNLGYAIQIGNSGGSRQVDENYQLADDVTWTHGAHTFKFGLDIRRLESNQYNLAGVFGGSYGFAAGATNNGAGSGGSALATFDLGLITSFSNTPAPVPAYYRWHYYAGYAQDDWKVRSNLTLSLGLRYEVETPRMERYDNQGTFIPTLTGTLNGLPATGAFCFSGSCGLHSTLWPTNYMGFEPRIGIAWVPKPFMTVRTSYAMMRAPLPGYGNTPVPDFNVPSVTVGGISGGVVPNEAVDYITNPVGPLTSALSALQGHGPFFTVPGLTVPYINQSSAVPYTQQWSFTLQFQVDHADMVQASYNGLVGTHIISRFAPALNYPDL